jgi:hypothetical protein
MTKSSPPLKFKLSNYGFRNSSGSLAMLAAIRLVAADGGKSLFGVSVQSTERHEHEQRKSKRER